MSNEEEFLDAVVAGDKEEISRLLGQAVDINSTDYGDLHSWVSYVMDAEHAFRLKELLDELDPLDLSGHYYTLLKDPEKQLVEKAWRVGRRFTAHEPSYNLPSKNKAYEGTSADSEPFNSGAAGALAICFIFAMVGIYVLLVVPQNPNFEGHYNRGNEQSQYKNYEDVTQTKEHPSLKTEAARLLKEQGYRDITLLGSPEEEACQRRETEEVIDGVVQKTQESYDGFRFEAGVANTNIKLDGTVCPEIDAVKVKDE